MSFEGIEGTGKSTQCRRLVNYLRRQGLKVIVLREPGSSVIGEQMRNILLHGKGKLSSFSEALLFMVARTQLVLEKINPIFEKKDVIILDRYIDATIAYQGYGGDVDIKLLKQLNNYAVSGVIPDLTILFDLTPKIGIKRSGRGDRFEKRKMSFHAKVRNGYLKLAKENPKRIKVIPVQGDISSVQKTVRGIFESAYRCGKRKGI